MSDELWWIAFAVIAIAALLGLAVREIKAWRMRRATARVIAQHALNPTGLDIGAIAQGEAAAQAVRLEI